MNRIVQLTNWINNYVDVKYFTRFLLVFFCLCGFHQMFRLFSLEGGALYSPFIVKYFNYPNALIWGILHVSSFFSHIIGLDTFVSHGDTLQIPKGASVLMARPCIGLINLFFWLAFVISQNSKLKRKLVWAIGGFLLICLVNSVRITFILAALNNSWWELAYMNHHDLFTYASYFIIGTMILLYHRRENVGKTSLVQANA